MPRRLAYRSQDSTTYKPTHKQGFYNPQMPVTHSLRVRLANLARQHHLPAEQIVALFEEQGGCCAICGFEAEMLTDLVLDHDHVTNAVRGFLCSTCNSVLGMARENPEILRAAASYLETYADSCENYATS